MILASIPDCFCSAIWNDIDACGSKISTNSTQIASWGGLEPFDDVLIYIIARSSGGIGLEVCARNAFSLRERIPKFGNEC